MSGIQDTLGFILLTLSSTIFSAITTSLLVCMFFYLFLVAQERRVFTRERSNRQYSVFSYFLAKIVGEIPALSVGCGLFAVIVYWAAEINDTFSYKYWAYVGTIILATIAGSNMSFLIGSLIEHQETLVNVNIMLSVPLFLLSGFFADATTYAPYLKPFEYLSAFKYTFQALVQLVFSDIAPTNCQNINPSICAPNANPAFSFLEQFYHNLIALGALCIFFNILGFLALYYFAKIKV